jgi:hypothetical protein
MDNSTWGIYEIFEVAVPVIILLVVGSALTFFAFNSYQKDLVFKTQLDLLNKNNLYNGEIVIEITDSSLNEKLEKSNIVNYFLNKDNNKNHIYFSDGKYIIK